MQKETLNKLRQYIDLAASHSSLSTTFPMGRWPEHEAGREQAWQKFVEAALAEEREAKELIDKKQDG